MSNELTPSSPLLSGKLFAVLEEIQLRSARWNINSTIVDRFYGSASTAPASVFGNLIKNATSAHLPKIRKAQLGHAELEADVEETMVLLNDNGGFRPTLRPKEQAEFALGFYTQRAHYAAERRKRQIQGNAQQSEGGN